MKKLLSGSLLAAPVLVVPVAAALVAGCNFLFASSDPVALCIEASRAQCEEAFNCCNDKERIERYNDAGVMSVQTAYVDSLGECHARSESYCEMWAVPFKDSIAAGRMEMNGENANACLTALKARIQTCGEPNPEEAEALGICNHIFVGLVEDGDDCAMSGECENKGTCSLVDDDGDDDFEVNEDLATKDGKCISPKLAKKGDNCIPEDPDDLITCEAGTFCNVAEEECEEIPGNGDSCEDSAGVCKPGLYCGADDAECHELKEGGKECDSGGECLSGECDDDECTDPICQGKSE